MPESPEVQVLAEVLGAHLVGRRLTAADVLEFRAVKTRTRPPESLAGATVTAVRRLGKHLDIATTEGRLVVSLGRHGWVRIDEAGDGGDGDGVGALASDAAPALVRLDIDGGDAGSATAIEITDAGGWVSIGLSVVDDVEEVPAVAGLGPDPLSDAFPDDLVGRVLRGRRKRVKALLVDQATFAGIGNAYSDEILFVAGIAPLAQGADLDDDARARVAAAVTGVLRSAADARRGIPIAGLKAAKVTAMQVHGRTGMPCPGCGGEVADVPGSTGGAQYCPACQTAGSAP